MPHRAASALHCGGGGDWGVGMVGLGGGGLWWGGEGGGGCTGSRAQHLEPGAACLPWGERPSGMERGACVLWLPACCVLLVCRVCACVLEPGVGLGWVGTGTGGRILVSGREPWEVFTEGTHSALGADGPVCLGDAWVGETHAHLGLGWVHTLILTASSSVRVEAAVVQFSFS